MFLQMMKKAIVLVFVALLSLSCGEYQKLLKSNDSGDKYVAGQNYYEEGVEEESKSKLRRALRLFEQIIDEYRGKPQGEKLSFLFADTYYHLGDNYLASYQFERFQQSYPNSEKQQEAAFKKAESFYHLSPRYDLDQTDTQKAVTELQNYLDTYPEGEYADQANEYAAELREKLEKKAFEIAKQYHKTGLARSGNLRAAIKSFDNFIKEYPGSTFREAAYYYRFDSAYILAVNSFAVLMGERLEEAKEYYESYRKKYPEGEYLETMEKAIEDIETRLQNS